MQKMLAREKSDYVRKVQEKAIIEKRQMAVEHQEAPEGEVGVAQNGEGEGGALRVLTLNHGEHQDATLYRFEKGCQLRFSPGPNLLGRKVFLYTNYVVSDNSSEEKTEPAFVRNQYYGLEWRKDDSSESLGSGLLVTDTDFYCEIKLSRAGSFHYYFVYDSSESRAGPAGSGWWQVSPALAAGGARVPLGGVMCQTVLAKCLGPLARWRRVLRAAREAGYNMIHFTPVQELGASNSSYSLANQLKLNPRFDDVDSGKEATFADVENVIAGIRNDWKMLSICDVVLNHTANESAWLLEHPEASYNCLSCPYLRPAALLDAVLARLGDDIAGGREPRVAPLVNTHQQLETIRHILLTERIPEMRLHEMYTCDVDEIVNQFGKMVKNKVPARSPAAGPALRLALDPQRRRKAATVDLHAALALYNIHRAECPDEEARAGACCGALRTRLLQLNEAAAADLRAHLHAAVDNCVAAMRYFRLQSDGPKIEEVSEKNPLVPRYFTSPSGARALGAAALGAEALGAEALEAEALGAEALGAEALGAEALGAEALEAALWGAAGSGVMAHNGWLMAADPLEDFAAQQHDGRVYLRRELIAWGDSVKLRYGEKPEDSPFLWAHMRQYVELTAEVFDGLRLDNCHSTPLHVAEYMLDCARSVKPELYVAAELFTNSDHVDNIFVNRLGITSLIREAQSAWESRELGRLVHRFGGRAVGSFEPAAAARPHVAHALFLDLTHDNPSPVQKRSVFDLLPSAALVSMASCATGSTRGYDELVPHHIHVVDESRLYPEWEEEKGEGVGVSAASGIMAARRALNDLHFELAISGYTEVYVDQMDADVVAVTRHDPISRKSVILVAFTAFKAPDSTFTGRYVKPLRFEGQLEEIVLEAVLKHKDHRTTGRPFQESGEFVRHPQYINGLSEYETSVRRGVSLAQSGVFVSERRDGAHTVLEFGALAPGSVVAVRVAPHARPAAALRTLRRLGPDPLGLAPALADLDLGDFNVLLYCCDAEERERGGGGAYDVPGHGPLAYAGLQGIVSLLEELAPRDDLGHALCENLRAGDWLLDYQWRRLEGDPRLAGVAARYREALRPVSELPRFLVPSYFEATVRRMHAAVCGAALARLSAAARSSATGRALALTSVQLAGAVRSARLPVAAPALSLSAGLPHFAVGYMRCWGRDTFIALRGLFLLTGRYQDARYHILGFGACLRHGLIPNLLDGGRNARFNCRDAVWWWLQSIKQYCTEAPQGYSILTDPVSRIFPKDDSEPTPPGVADQPLHDVMQEALDVHFQGLVFRERNAGRQIDAHMSDKGFNVQIGVDPETGFPFGGNEANCGTWMDKMGSSEAAGTRGKPATPRDGSAVELVALAYDAAAWLAGQHRGGRYPYPGVARRHRDGSLTAWTFAQWAERIRRSFERHFWVPAAPSAADARPDLVHRRAIYKDTHGASQPWADYQLRCNCVVAMAVAPDLFDPRHAWLALDNVERLLLGPLGLKTLDPGDWAYRPDYDNSNNGDDPAVAHGFNYHQGPEWAWPLSFYLRARLAFAHDNGCHAKTVATVYAALGPLVKELRSSPWRGLPELSNAGGAYCRDSCRTQAWSSGCALEVLHDLERATRARQLSID